ncbi:membrane protein [Companilactobacillus sp. RD055328]|uniref:YitT family protein n=1 Tax=Companilactobacillus sp. RD055328 TaxID=2916634 RepID=UPI001FC888B3|nr:YitT family protein [Companilactobacillus sp. RD055328]GKQ42653.1 membrane protein [Companilactobacillus sp. RD055328]
MEEIDRIFQRHQTATKLSVAFIYALCVSVAVNLFWSAGHTYGSGITGFAQVVTTFSEKYLPFKLTTSLMVFVLNAPLFYVSYKKIGKKFTFFTAVAVIMSSIMLQFISPIVITTDPLICAIFGALVNGFGTGFALKNGISTGGLDIIGILLRQKTGRSVGTTNIMFNALIIIAAGLLYGWPNALYSAVGIFVNGRIIDMMYTGNQKLQVMIVTSKPKKVISEIQDNMRRGITVVHGAEGAYRHEEKTILFTVIARYEMDNLKQAMNASDPVAFVSITDSIKILGNFYQDKIY